MSNIILSSKLRQDRSRSRQSGWPEPLGADALYGLAGTVAATIDCHTESDLVAILVQFLIAFGNLIGRKAHFIVDGSTHRMNLFAVLVGETAVSRKGTSWNQVKRLMGELEYGWIMRCIKSGLSSGEGLIAAIANPPKIKPKTGESPLASVLVSPPAGRLLVVEPEFDVVLQVAQRNGNTISAVIRQAWEGDVLSTLTKEPMEASDAHISIIGHITRSELKRDLDTICAANGFANRFVWICVQRSKSLPHGGSFHLEDHSELVERILECKKFVDDFLGWDDAIELDSEARDLWESVYDDLTGGNAGLIAAIVARAAPIVRRFACLYALLDQEVLIRASHLRAALALWKYCDDSAQYIFGNASGDPVLDRILENLRATPQGLTRTNINRLFHGNTEKSKIDFALKTLVEKGKVHMQKGDDGRGRPAETWFATEG